jgi:nanoRNase/pAp phosphatase (c-di-AMP/oligoRNAs hydrolase)
MKNYQVSEIKNLLTTAKTALIAVPQLSIDSIGSALALALLLKKSNITTKVFCPQKTDDNYTKLNGLELLTDIYNPNDLIVTLDYPLDRIEKVTYNQDNGKLNLVVQTKDGSPKVAENQILISNQASAADINFILGDETLLGANSNIVSKGNWINISPTNIEKSWAKASIVDQDAPFSEILTFLLPMLGFELDPGSAKNLLIALRVATQSFSINVSPETFEAGANCLRATQLNENIPQIEKPIPTNPVPTV